MIDKIDFSKLKPYDGKVAKSFEQLCYQIALNEYGHLGQFTPIAGSGGDGGVEFYLDFPDGVRWGWQCKYYEGSGRLNESSRKTSIENSLTTACRNHSNLKKWILCLKTDFTTDSIDKNKKLSKGEESWFSEELKNKIPSGRTIELEHWGESKFVTYLAKAKNTGIRNFFFGELEFNEIWFKNKFDENFALVKDKYDPELHTIDKFIQSKIDFILFDKNFCSVIFNLKNKLIDKSTELTKMINNILSNNKVSIENSIREQFLKDINRFVEIDKKFQTDLDFITECFGNFKNEEFFSKFNLEDLLRDLFIFKIELDNYKPLLKDSDRRNFNDLILNYKEILFDFLENNTGEFKLQKEIHFFADAAKGKTHLSTDIAYKRINSNKPALFIPGLKFTNETSLNDAIMKILGLPKNYSIEDFIEALDVYGSISNSKIPIIIDGLNETTNNSAFSKIWECHLSSFISQISKANNIVIITTCRKSYKARIWKDSLSEDKFCYIEKGFENYETVEEAVKKYFVKYKLKSNFFFPFLKKFENPIFLKIFCEIKNPNYLLNEEIEVNVTEESLYDIIESYLKQINKRVTLNHPLLRENEKFIFESLDRLAEYLWIENKREIDIKTFHKLIDGDNPYKKDFYKADILINEGLVFTKDIRGEGEFVSFTYQVFSGYFVAISLIKVHEPEYFVSHEFVDKLFKEDKEHPLYDDIINSLCLLLPKFKNTTLHEIINAKTSDDNKTKEEQNYLKYCENTTSASIITLFSLPPELIKDKDLIYVEECFQESNENKAAFFELFISTLSYIEHPLNANFLDVLLLKMKVAARDLNWSEYLRLNSKIIRDFIRKFEDECKNQEEKSTIILKKIHLISRIISWFLTSNERTLRDEATQALYYYGRKFPKEYSSLVFYSLEINDPYVWERTLCALYGACMAEHNSLESDKFRVQNLPEIASQLYNLIFIENAKYPTTHILARNYARRVIEIALIHYPDLLSEKEIINIRPPYSFGKLKKLEEFDYENSDFERIAPIQMDFSNYTIGMIVKDGASYSDPPEKIQVRKQIYWRIFDLGWTVEHFSIIDRNISDGIFYNFSEEENIKIERYGKKYSWIAYFENAGVRDDLGLLPDSEGSFRVSCSDIDPSFPKKPINKKFFNKDILGDRDITIEDWYNNGGMPFVEEYLNMYSPGRKKEWICLDGYITQEENSSERASFVFIRSFIVKENEYIDLVNLLKKQKLAERWLPEIKDNRHAFAGELYRLNDSTEENYSSIEFEINKKVVKIPKQDPNYRLNFDYSIDFIDNQKEMPEFIMREFSETQKFDVLMPVMGFIWEGYHCHLNNVGHSDVVSREIVNHLKLIDQPQTFDLLDLNGDKASISDRFFEDYGNNHNFVYLRKDLLDKFLIENKMKFVCAIWGERQVRFQNDELRTAFFNKNPYSPDDVFQKIVEYG